MSALTSLLVRDQVVPVRKIEEAIQRQVIAGGDLETILLEMEAVPEDVMSAYRSATFGLLPATRDEVMRVPRDVTKHVPREIAERHRLLPLAVDGRTLIVAVATPLKSQEEHQLAFLLGKDLVFRIVTEVRISTALGHHYSTEVPPRFRRLADKLRARDPGVVPYVAPPIPAKPDELSKHSLPPLPPQSFDWDESEDDRSDERPLPSREVVMNARASQEPAPVSESPAVAMKRHRGPLSAKDGVELLKQAQNRDDILGVLFVFARQFFDYTALFTVQDDVVEGRDAFGSGASSEQVQQLSISLEQRSAFRLARDTAAPQVTTLGLEDADRDLIAQLGRDRAQPALVMPFSIRSRVVLVLYADRGGESFNLGDIPELLGFAPRLADAFERLILRRKRSAAPGALQGVARTSQPSRPLTTPPPSNEPRSVRAPRLDVPTVKSDRPRSAPPRTVLLNALGVPRTAPPPPAPADAARAKEAQRAEGGQTPEGDDDNEEGPPSSGAPRNELPVRSIVDAHVPSQVRMLRQNGGADDANDAQAYGEAGKPDVFTQRETSPEIDASLLEQVQQTAPGEMRKTKPGLDPDVIAQSAPSDKPKPKPKPKPAWLRSSAYAMITDDAVEEPAESVEPPAPRQAMPPDPMRTSQIPELTADDYELDADTTPGHVPYATERPDEPIPSWPQLEVGPANELEEGTTSSWPVKERTTAPMLVSDEPGLFDEPPPAPVELFDSGPEASPDAERETAKHSYRPDVIAASTPAPEPSTRSSWPEVVAAPIDEGADDLVSEPPAEPKRSPSHPDDSWGMRAGSDAEPVTDEEEDDEEPEAWPEVSVGFDPRSSGFELDDGEDDATERSTHPERLPSTSEIAKPPQRVKPRRKDVAISGAYIARNVSVDVVGGPGDKTPSRSIRPPSGERARSLPPERAQSLPPQRAQSLPPERAGKNRSRSVSERRRDPRAEDDSMPRAERVAVQSLPHVDTTERRGPASEKIETGDAPIRKRSSPDVPVDQPSVIVDMGDSIERLVAELCESGPDDEGHVVDMLLRLGEGALPVLVQRFPGPLWVTRTQAVKRRIRARDLSAVARAMLAFKERAVPYLASLIESRDDETRLYAVLIAGETPHPELVQPLVRRLLDADEDVRAAATDVLKAHRQYGKILDEALKEIRSMARTLRPDVKSRILAVRALAELRDVRSLSLLIELLRAPDPPLVEEARRALALLTRQDFGIAYKKWQTWEEKNGSRHRIEWLIDALTHADEPMRAAAGDELKTLTQEYFGYHPALPKRDREIAQKKYRAWWDEQGVRKFSPVRGA